MWTRMDLNTVPPLSGRLSILLKLEGIIPNRLTITSVVRAIGVIWAPRAISRSYL